MKAIDPVTPTENESQLLPENGNAKFFRLTCPPVSSLPNSASHFSAPVSTRYPAPSGVNRTVRPARSNGLAFPGTPSFSVNTIRFPCVEMEPIDFPGSCGGSCACNKTAKAIAPEIIQNTRELLFMAVILSSFCNRVSRPLSTPTG